LTSPFSGSPAVRAHCLDHLLTRALSFSHDLFTESFRALSNQSRLLQDRLTSAESDASRYRDQYQSERDRNFTRLQDMETERVTLRTENAILTEKLAQAKMEVDSAKKRESTQLNERVFGMEAECRALKEETRRKDLQIGELTNEAVRASNEHA